MANRKYYVMCGSNCKYESMTKEQILTAITQAVETGEIKDVDTGFVQTIKTINGIALKFFVGEQSEYEALSAEEKKNLFAIITNDTTKESLYSAIENINKNIDDVNDALQNHDERITAVKKKADSTAETVSDHSTDIGNLKTKTSANEKSISSINSTIATMQENIATKATISDRECPVGTIVFVKSATYTPSLFSTWGPLYVSMNAESGDCGECAYLTASDAHQGSDFITNSLTGTWICLGGFEASSEHCALFQRIE